MSTQHLPPEDREKAICGAAEADLVGSGQEGTLVSAYRKIREAARERDTDLRPAGWSAVSGSR